MISGIVYSIGDWIAQVKCLFRKSIFKTMINHTRIVLDFEHFSAMKENHSLSLIEPEHSDLALLDLPFMDPFHIFITSCAR